MEKMHLYNMAANSIKRYKGSGEKLTDFDEFMDEIEKKYNTRKYKVILTPDTEGYMVTVPDFNCNTQGRDIEEALAMAKEVIELMAGTLQKIPEPDSVAYKPEPDDIIKYIKVNLLAGH